MAFVPALFGAIGSAFGITGAGVTAGESIAAGIGITTAVAGVGSTLLSMANQPKAPTEPKVPDPNVAAQQAQEAQDAKRRSLLASGGKTDMTSGMAQLGTGQVQLKTLLGG